MIKIIEIGKILKKQLHTISLLYCNNNKAIFIDTNNPSNNPEIITYYTGIIKLNCKTEKVDEFKFDKPIYLFSIINSTSTIYYAGISEDNSKYQIDIYKMNYDSFENNYIATINTEFDKSNEDHFDNLSLNSRLITLNDRYSIFLLPYIKFREPFFHKVLLIDSAEKKVYEIPKPIGSLDSILNLDEVYPLNNQYVIFKTGRIGDFEKRQIWQNKKQNEVLETYNNNLENLIVYEINEFVNNVKKLVPISKNNIIQTCDLREGVRTIKNYEGKAIYSIQHFMDMSTSIKIFDVESQKVKVVNTVFAIYDYIQYFNQKLYGFVRKNNIVEVYDVTSKKKLFNANGLIMYIDNDIFIEIDYEFIDENFKHILKICDSSNGNIVNKFKINSYYVNYNENILYIS